MANKSQSQRYRPSRQYNPVDAPNFPGASRIFNDALRLIWAEFSKIRQSVRMAHDHDSLVIEPVRPRDFQVRFADGSPGWDPGLGRGPYYWDEQTEQWVKLSGEVVDPTGDPPSTGLSDHGALGGLGDDDHLQYLTNARGDARYYLQSEVDTLRAAKIGSVVEDTTPQLGGYLDLNSKGITGELTAAVTLAAGDLCYLNSNGKMAKADATTEATSKTLIAICTEALAADAVGTFLLKGYYVTSGLTAGDILYIDTTAGGWTNTAPTSLANVVRILGYALSTTQIFFDPDKTWIEV